MNRVALATCAGAMALFGSSSSTAQNDDFQSHERIGSLPQAGVISVAAVGNPVFQRFRYSELSVAATLETASMSFGFAEITLHKGEPLYRVPSKTKFKACVGGSGPCGLDDLGNGTFSRVSVDTVTSAWKLKEPVPYRIEKQIGHSPNSFRQVTTFLGVSAGTIRFSYREFAGDLARPAFTEELSFPIGGKFPQELSYKDVHMTLLGIDANGLRYQIDSAAN